MIFLAGKPLTSLVLSMPRSGRWYLTGAVADTDAEPSETVAVTDDEGAALVCNIVAQAADSKRVAAAGGPATLRAETTARSYVDAEVKTIAADLLGSAYSKRSTPEIAKTRLPFWTRLGSHSGHTVTVSEALRRLAEDVGAVWRVLDDGSVWIGVDTYPEIDDFDATVLEHDAPAATLVVGLGALKLRPGQTWRGYRVGAVEYSLGGDEGLRATVYYV